MAIEYIVPNADNSDGSWTNNLGNNTNLYSYVDNGISGGTVDNNTFIQSSTTTTVALDIETIAGTRTASSDVIFRYMHSGNFVTHTVALYEGTTEIWTSNFQSIDASAGFIENEQTIPSADVDNITDYSDLNVRVENSFGSDLMKVSEIELEFDTDGGGGGGSAVADFIRFENGCMSDFRGMVNIRG
jgi:hypothetical protein